MMGISIWQLLIILAIVLLLFGTKRLRNIGGDVGSAIKNFKSSMSDGEKQDTSTDSEGKQLKDDSQVHQQASSDDKEKNHV